MTTYGFLHTADVHRAVFDHLLADISPGDHAVHIVDVSLLTDARRRGGVDDDLRARIGAHIGALTGRGARRVVCTCSTIGAASEEIGATLGAAVERVDRPMARRAVTSGERIAIVAAVESTVAPTRLLLVQAAEAAQRRVELIDSPCPDAWALWEAGDHDGYLARLAAHLVAIDGSVDVIVLAQASMAPLQDRVRLRSVLLTSPRLAVEDLVTH